MSRRTRNGTLVPTGAALLAAGVLAAACSSGGSSSPSTSSGSSAPVTIKAVLPPNTGPITAADNAGLQTLTQQYQSAFQNDQYGYGMAIGTLLFVVMLVFTLAAMRLLRPRTT